MLSSEIFVAKALDYLWKYWNIEKAWNLETLCVREIGFILFSKLYCGIAFAIEK